MQSRHCRLKEPGWTPQCRAALEELINKGSGKRLPVVFDFDNTVVCGDIGEAVLAVLARDGTLSPEKIPRTLSPPFRHLVEGKVSLESALDLTDYYEALLSPTVHQEEDTTPLANGYAWAVEIMEGLTPLDVTKATRKAYGASQPGKRNLIEVTPGKAGYPAPFFYPEMVELIAELLRHAFDFWILSASNVWSVRWMMLNGLNPLLRKRGVRNGVRADHVIGISTLLANAAGKLYKDPILVQENAGYARLDPAALRRFRLTSRLCFPVSTYSGKVAWIYDVIGRQPYLCAGDSPGDHPMLGFSEHRLWIARVEKAGYQKALVQLARRRGNEGWLVQPVASVDRPGFIAAQVNEALGEGLEPLRSLRFR